MLFLWMQVYWVDGLCVQITQWSMKWLCMIKRFEIFLWNPVVHTESSYVTSHKSAWKSSVQPFLWGQAPPSNPQHLFFLPMKQQLPQHADKSQVCNPCGPTPCALWPIVEAWLSTNSGRPLKPHCYLHLHRGLLFHSANERAYCK